MAGCAKALAIIGASLVTAVGLAGVAISIYLFVGNKIWDSVIGNYQLTFAILFIVVSCLVVLTGAFGIFGACNDKKCLLHLFWILLAVWLCGFIAAGVVAVILPNKVLSNGCTADTFNIFQSLDTVSQNAIGSQFCKSCACYIANTTGLPGTFNGASTSYIGQAKNVQGCSAGDWSPSNTDSVLAGLEIAFGCSGWCNSGSIFYFSNNDEADKRPSESCFSGFSSFFSKYGQYVYIASFVFAGLCLILMICTWVYICQINEVSKY